MNKFQSVRKNSLKIHSVFIHNKLAITIFIGYSHTHMRLAPLFNSAMGPATDGASAFKLR